MDVISLQSGSNGNCFFVASGDVRLLVDAGITGVQAERRLAQHGIDIRSVTALLITHDHRDHIVSAGVFQRKYNIPIYVTRSTLLTAQRWCNLGRLADVRHFRSGDTLDIGHVAVHTVPTPHDGADGVAFVIEDGQRRVGILTDLGHVFDGLRDVLMSLDAVVIESNYDVEMLRTGSYPEQLKRRIAGPSGHLSNDESAALVGAGSRLQWALLAHLSEENNRPQIAQQTHREATDGKIAIHVASRYQASPKLYI